MPTALQGLVSIPSLQLSIFSPILQVRRLRPERVKRPIQRTIIGNDDAGAGMQICLTNPCSAELLGESVKK